MSQYALDDVQYERMIASSKTLRKLSKALERDYGIPMQQGDGLQLRVRRQIDRILDDRVRQAVTVSYKVGCAAGVAAARPTDEWSLVNIPPRLIRTDLTEGDIRVGQQKIALEDLPGQANLDV